MEFLLQQTDQWKKMLQSPGADPKEMLKVLTSIVSQTVHIYSNRRFSFVLFTLLDNSSNALAHFQHLDHISGDVPSTTTILDPGGSKSSSHPNNLAQHGAKKSITQVNGNEVSASQNVAGKKKTVLAPSVVIPQVKDVHFAPSLDNEVSHCELAIENHSIDIISENVDLDSSLEAGSIIEQQEIMLDSENDNTVTPDVVLNSAENIEMTIETSDSSQSRNVPKQVTTKKVATLKNKRPLAQKGVTRQDSCPPRSLQAGCCIFCCEVINTGSVKEHYLSSHVQKENDGYVMKCQVCEHSYKISHGISPSDLFSVIQNMEEHMAVVHPMQSIFKCADCNFVTFSTEELANHSQSHHSTPEGGETSQQIQTSPSQDRVAKSFAIKVTENKTSPSKNPAKLIKECIFCLDKANAPKQINVTDFKKHFMQEHVRKEDDKWKMKCPRCPAESVLAIGDSSISQLLFWGLSHFNTQHDVQSNLPGVPVLHCKQCQLISTSKDNVCEHMKALNSPKMVTSEGYTETEEEENLSGVRPSLVCFLCQQGGSTINTLEECKAHFASHHLQRITSTASLKCNLCNAEFSCLPNEVEQHLTFLIKTCAVHFGKVHGQPISQFFHRFKCPHCSYYSILKKDIWKHKEDKHTNSVVCDKCGKVLKVHSLMSSHRNFCKGNLHRIKYKCSRCDQLFSSPGARNSHMKIIHLKNLEHACSYCQKKFSKKHNLELHVLHCHQHNDTQKETEKCPVCGFLTFAGYQMENHMKTHQLGEYKCKHCEAIFPTRRKLYHHVETKHTTKEMLQCEECNYKTREKVTMIQHVNRIHRGMSITCSICKYRALDETKLKAHMDSKHADTLDSTNGTKSFPCSMCDKIFSTKHRLETHAFNIHSLNMTNKPIHQCSSCSYKAIEKSMLKLHVQNAHGSLAIFNCQICGRAFKSHSKLQNHKRRSHPVKNKFQCDMCNYVTDSKSQFVLHHSRKHSGKRMKCPICKYATYQQHLYNRHMESKHTKQEIEAHRSNGELSAGVSNLSTPGPPEMTVPSKGVTPSLFTMSWQPELPNEVTVSSARNVHLVSQNPNLIGRTGSLCVRQTDLHTNKAAAIHSKPSIPASLINTHQSQQVAAQSLKSTPGEPLIPKPHTLITQHGSFLQRLLAPSYWDNASQ